MQSAYAINKSLFNLPRGINLEGYLVGDLLFDCLAKWQVLCNNSFQSVA